jgi:hypothetical protein
MVYYPSLVASNKALLRFQTDLATTAVPVGSTSDALGLVLCNIHSAFPGAEVLRVTLAGIKTVTAIAGAGSTTALTAFLQKNGGNNVSIPSSGDCSIASISSTKAAGTRDLEIGENATTKIFMRHSGADTESFKLVLAATGAATVPGTTSGIVEVCIEVEFVSEGLPRA